MERGIPLHSLWGAERMPNFRDWTASEIAVQMPAARNILAKHFGPDGLKSGSGNSLRELARQKSVDLELVLRDLNAAAKGTNLFS